LIATSVADPIVSTAVSVALSSSSNSNAVDVSDPSLRDLQAVGFLSPVTPQDSFDSYAPTPQSQRGLAEKQVHYKIINLGTLGGSFAEGNGISNRGWISGFSTLLGDQSTHATLWTEDTGLQDLGTLGGPNSSISFPVKDSRGLLVGGADTSVLDPFNEGICGGAAVPFTTPDPYICRGFLWQRGRMTPLSTLGGNNSFAENVNDSGQIVGFAETADSDPNCIAPQVFDLQPVMWGPDGQIQALPLLPGDIFGAATGINEKGQVTGVSSPFCAPGPVVTTIESHLVLWEKGVPINLGSLGGVANNFPFAINDQGDIVGQSDLTGDTTAHAFLWTQERGMQDLGTLPGDISSVALGMNNKGQVVGGSCDANGNCPAFLWQDGVMTDLNTLVCGGSSLFLDFGGDINDHGEISGQAIDPSTGALVAFLAIPIHDGDGCQAGPLAEQKVALPENIRKQLQRRFSIGPR
jgi:probable HAF family extracellular repeat protein